MSNLVFQWTESDGDHSLSVDGEYFGLVCTHGRMPKLVWNWGDYIDFAHTLDGAKRLMERKAVATRAADEAYNRSLEDTVA